MYAQYPADARRSGPPVFHALLLVLGYVAKQLSFQNILSLFVLLTCLECLVIFPAYRLIALSARDVSHDVSAGGHIALARFTRDDVDNVIKEVGFAMLATEVPTDNVLVVGKMSLAVFAAIDLVAIQVYVIR